MTRERGIQNIWQQTSTDTPKPTPPGVCEFPGVAFVIGVDVHATTAGDSVAARAGTQLGRAVSTLWATPDGKAEFSRLRLSREPPPAAKITLTLGDLTLYAVASSTVAEFAVARALDRLALALDTLSRLPAGKGVLEQHGIQLRRKA